MAKLSSTGFFVLLSMMVIGTIIYLRLWTVQGDLDLTDTRIDRIIFEQAQSEALDEAAEWRKKYDEEVENSSESMQKLLEVTQSVEKKNQRLENLETRLRELQKENHGLLRDVAKLKQQVEDQKLKCAKTGIKEV
jgi:predicted nuclease with TOPRIM domain